MMTKHFYGALIAVGIFFTSGCQPLPSNESPPTTDGTVPTRVTTFSEATFSPHPTLPAPSLAPVSANCEFRPTPVAPASRPVKPPPNGRAPTDPAQIHVVLNTNQGKIPLTLHPETTPCTVLNFVSLSEQHFFDYSSCHRMTTKNVFLLQCGDPSGTGSGGPGYSFADEYPIGSATKTSSHNSRPLYPRGTIAMANSGPDTNGSQFFLTYKDSPLPPHYTIFGSVDKNGLKIIDTTAQGGIFPSPSGEQEGKPKKPLEILTIELP